ncbi:hypothetical protein [Actinomadura miaoliensis]|uniref:Uncharacterized protein n=1 Tax=Actinomadura miaoliensis TaxID=430685 RepID=A0ABP7V7B1_9ACTN
MAYATVQELADFLTPKPAPPDAARLLDRASRDVDRALLCTVYDVDDTGMPTAPAVAQALKEATLEQAAWRMRMGDGASSAGKWSTVSIGSASLARRTDRTAPDEAHVGGLGADAFEVLQLAGLTGHAPQTPPICRTRTGA